MAGKAGNREFDKFLQLNAPLKLNGKVVAILTLNKVANTVAEQVTTNTFKLLRFTDHPDRPGPHPLLGGFNENAAPAQKLDVRGGRSEPG